MFCNIFVEHTFNLSHDFKIRTENETPAKIYIVAASKVILGAFVAAHRPQRGPGAGFKCYSIVVAPSERFPSLDGHPPPKAAKSGHFDDTVLIGDPASLAAGRSWIKPLMAAGPPAREVQYV